MLYQEKLWGVDKVALVTLKHHQLCNMLHKPLTVHSLASGLASLWLKNHDKWDSCNAHQVFREPQLHCMCTDIACFASWPLLAKHAIWVSVQHSRSLQRLAGSTQTASMQWCNGHWICAIRLNKHLSSLAASNAQKHSSSIACFYAIEAARDDKCLLRLMVELCFCANSWRELAGVFCSTSFTAGHSTLLTVP